MFGLIFVLIFLGIHGRSLASDPSPHLTPELLDLHETVAPLVRVRRLAGVPKPVWHVGVYTKKYITPWTQICGGSIVRPDVVISAAHCFWTDTTPKPTAEEYAVGANKIYRVWNNTSDKEAQKSDVSEIHLAPRFRGESASFQADIAVLKLVTPFQYTRRLRPICVDFDEEFESQQLKPGNRGTIAGWGLTSANGSVAQRLLWLELPYVAIEQCLDSSEEAFRRYITFDKICAGQNSTGKALCRGDSGGGLAFFRGRSVDAVPYLRGIASVAPRNENLCNQFALAAYTLVSAHRSFLLDHVPGIDKDCQYKEKTSDQL